MVVSGGPLSMENKWNFRFGKKSTFVLAGFLILIIAGGVVFFSKRVPPQNSIPRDTHSTPVVNDTNQPQATDGTSDKFGLDIELSDGQSAPQTVETFPLAAGVP